MSATPARLRTLDVRDFRNLAHVELAPPAEGFVVVGENGQGKTNLLEAIHYLQILRSSRGVRDQDLVRFGADGFHIRAEIDTDHVHEIGVGFERVGKRKRVRIDGAVPERLSEALGALPSVMFSPDDVELVAGSPAARRRYLDIMLALTTRGYLNALQRYRGALLRRNAALREASRAHKSAQSANTVAVWEPALAEHGAFIWSARAAWVEAVASRFEQLCARIGETAQMHVRYASPIAMSDDPASTLAAALEEKRGHDLRRGITHAGPHRDDLTITLDGRDLRTFGSAGQQRSAAIALRMLEAETFADRTGRAPVFLLDDPFAELDLRRSARILEMLTHVQGERADQQTILAVPRESDIPRALTRLERLCVSAGNVSRFGP